MIATGVDMAASAPPRRRCGAARVLGAARRRLVEPVYMPERVWRIGLVSGGNHRVQAAGVLVLALGLGVTAVSNAHEVTGRSRNSGRPDLDYVKAAIAEAKALDAIGRGGFSSSSAYVPQCVFRYAGCISGCSSAETACYVVAYPDDAKRTNYGACVDEARRCRSRCCDLKCAREAKLVQEFPCDF